MRISTKLKQDLIKYNLNFPTDGRAKTFKEQVKKFKIPELYARQQVHRFSEHSPTDSAYLCETDVSKYV